MSRIDLNFLLPFLVGLKAMSKAASSGFLPPFLPTQTWQNLSKYLLYQWLMKNSSKGPSLIWTPSWLGHETLIVLRWSLKRGLSILCCCPTQQWDAMVHSSKNKMQFLKRNNLLLSKFWGGFSPLWKGSHYMIASYHLKKLCLPGLLQKMQWSLFEEGLQ